MRLRLVAALLLPLALGAATFSLVPAPARAAQDAERRQILPDPGNLTGYRGKVDTVLYFEVTGKTGGSVWGDGSYTDDSTLATAAVHAGVLKEGEKGIVKVTVLPGLQSYPGSTRNGITTASYGPWSGSYRVEPANGGRPIALPDPGSLTGFRDKTGQVFYFEVTGRTTGSVWGDEVYTDDSALAAAAVHVGVLKDGEKRVVKVTILPGRDSYGGAARNGVTSSPYGAWHGSYRVDPAPDGPKPAPPVAPAKDPDNLIPYRGKIGQSFLFEVTGKTTGLIWGNDVYTDDSELATAAVHAGALRDGEKGIVKVTIFPGLAEYGSVERNGITSRSYGAWSGSYRVEPYRP